MEQLKSNFPRYLKSVKDVLTVLLQCAAVFAGFAFAAACFTAQGNWP